MKIHTFEVELGSEDYWDEPGVPHKVKLAGVTIWTGAVSYMDTEEDVLAEFAETLAGVIRRDQER